MKSISILFFTFFVYVHVLANDIIQINSNQFYFDNNKNLIVTNMDVNEVNSTWANIKTQIMLDELCTFETPIETVEVGIAYTVYVPSKNANFQLYFTELPIISITTTNTIVDAPNVWANFKMIESNQNFLESDIGIQYRGAWSQTLPKKSLEFEFWTDPEGSDSQDYQLLDMVTNDSWNLQAMYNEPMRIRSKTNNDIWRLINVLPYQAEEPEAINGIRMKYVEIFINNEYRGVYSLGEKVNRKQLKLKKHNGSIRGELYKGDQWGNTTFTSLPPFNNNSDVWGGFEYKHPKEEIKWESLYDFADFVINSSNTDFYSQYESKFHLDNLVDYYIFLNLLRATDNTGKNLFIAKYDTNSPYFYVPWDLDGSFGTIWDGSNNPTTNDLLTNGLYTRLMQDCSNDVFRERLKSKWVTLRQNVISYNSLIGMFNESHDLLASNGVYERESIAWSGFTYNPNDLTYMSNWMTNRLAYLDNKLIEDCEFISTNELTSIEKQFKIFPNPTSDWLFFKSDVKSELKVAVYNNLGQLISEYSLSSDNNKINLSQLNNGIYLLKITNNQTTELQKVVVDK